MSRGKRTRVSNADSDPYTPANRAKRSRVDANDDDHPTTPAPPPSRFRRTKLIRISSDDDDEYVPPNRIRTTANPSVASSSRTPPPLAPASTSASADMDDTITTTSTSAPSHDTPSPAADYTSLPDDSDADAHTFLTSSPTDDEASNPTLTPTDRAARRAVRHMLTHNTRITSSYTVTAVLGWGGNGVVVSATELDGERRDVAIKVIYKPLGAGGVPHEVRVVSSPSFPVHPCLVRYVTWFEDEGAWYLVMEKFGYVPGDDDKVEDTITAHTPMGTVTLPITRTSPDLFSLLTKCGKTGLPHETVRRIFKQIVSGIAALHDAGFVHGDIKEENVLVEVAEGGDVRVKVADFGHTRR
ncbi:hypothetical protein HK104_007713, partial [Borealophlyctis nickersoniae]